MPEKRFTSTRSHADVFCQVTVTEQSWQSSAVFEKLFCYCLILKCGHFCGSASKFFQQVLLASVRYMPVHFKRQPKWNTSHRQGHWESNSSCDWGLRAWVSCQSHALKTRAEDNTHRLPWRQFLQGLLSTAQSFLPKSPSTPKHKLQLPIPKNTRLDKQNVSKILNQAKNLSAFYKPKLDFLKSVLQKHKFKNKATSRLQ